MLNAVDDEEESSDHDSASESDSDVGDMVEDVMKRYNEQEHAADIEKDMLGSMCVYVYVYICVREYTYWHVDICTCVYTRVCVCMYLL